MFLCNSAKMAAKSVACMRNLRFVVDGIINGKRITNHRLKIKPVLGISHKLISIRCCTTAVDSSAQVKQSENPAEQQPENEKKQKEEIDGLHKEISELKENLLTFEDKYKRSLAENENLRVRFTKQNENTKIYSIQDFCKDLIEVGDVLQRALDSVPKQEINDQNPHLKNLYEGLVMTEAQLQNVFRRHKVVPINPMNEKFDPNSHEALFQQEVEGKEAGTVVVVSKIGYKLHDRVIRPALVGVAKSPAS